MNTRKITSSAPGKLILLGEYAVLEGAPAVVAAINHNANVHISANNKGKYSVESPGLGISPQPFELLEGGKMTFPETDDATRRLLIFFSAAIESALQESPIELPPSSFLLETDQFYFENTGQKLGLGSSAALSIALLNGIFEFADHPFEDKYRLFQQAVRAHYRAQGKMGSGVDIAASAIGGVLQYQITPGDPLNAMIEPLDLPENLFMLVVWSGNPASTRELVSRVNAFRQRDAAGFSNILTAMSDISFEGSHAIANAEIDKFLDCVDEYFQRMTELGERSIAPIVTAEHAAIREIAKTAGAVYKPSGAGGGDLGIAFATSPDIIEAAADALAKAGYSPIDAAIAHRGVHISSD